jgi:long-subunit acyl-CoA synthetase (AMP-forming)/1-acyl-sn-glycerol-3-phosphate acyltransferase/acyl carrier protein
MRDHLASLVDDFRRYGRQTAVVRFQGNRRRTTTYGELARLAGRFAALLERRGIGPGDRVLLWGENSAEWMATFHGCILRGVLAVPLDAYGSAEFARRVAADVKPKLAVGDALLLGQLGDLDSHSSDKNKDVARVGHPESVDSHPFHKEREMDGAPSSTFNSEDSSDETPGFPLLAFEDWPGTLPEEEAGAVAGLGRETPLEILFTSGTTGDPKGVVLTHGNVLASVEPIERGAQHYLRYERPFHPLRFLETLPLSHVFGQTMGLWMPPIFAAEVHFESRLVAGRLIETIKRERISVLAAVPRVSALLKTHLEAEHPGLSERLATSKGIRAWQRWWRFREIHREFGFKFWALISGGGALGGALEEFWNRLGFVVVQGYGMTETSALITLNHPFHVAKGTIGKPLPGREVKLGADGEVLVRGPMISTASWTGGALQARADEWLATGDLAENVAGGELRFLGRKSEVIVTSAGVNLHPEDLEAAIEQEPSVAACAVVAMETASGPEPCAVLAMRGDGAAAAIERANQRLAEFQRLRRWVLWPEPDLPRTSSGKVRRKAVSAWLKGIQDAEKNGEAAAAGAFGASGDWLLKLIAEISGETPRGVGDELRLSEDLLLDSLGRVQLAAALEERLGVALELEQARTLGELRGMVAGEALGGTSLAQSPLEADKEGNWHFGELSAGVANAIGRPSAEIRLRPGDEVRGLQHIDQKHSAQIAAKGFSSSEDFVRYVAQNFDQVYARPKDPNGLDFVVNNDPRGRMIASLEYHPEGNFYDVKTAHPVRADLYKNKVPLWERTGPSPSTAEAAPLSPGAKAANESVAQKENKVNYPRWPWLWPFHWLRVAFIEAVERPLVWLLAAPRVVAPALPANCEPMLIVANHVSTYDGPLIQCALPGRLRRRMAAAMAGDMLEDYRHFRNPESSAWWRRFYLPGPLIWLLLTALFNVFPLPRRRDFQRSFAHAGEAMDRGYNVLIFPEGTRSAAGELARFRGGIGLLVKQSGAMVLPVGLRGLGELKAAGRGWFRSGRIEVRVGEPIRFGPEESEAAITERLHAEVERLVGTRD